MCKQQQQQQPVSVLRIILTPPPPSIPGPLKCTKVCQLNAVCLYLHIKFRA